MESIALPSIQKYLKEVVRRTPLIPSQEQKGVYFKAENLQITGSFKIRPAFAGVTILSTAERSKGIVTSSSGNFAQGAAYACRALAVSAKVVMMRSCSPLKVERTRQLGAEVVFCDDRFEARGEKVREIHQTEGRTVIHPYDHPAVVAGNATIGLEILEQLPELEHVVVPVSGGGLISGIACAIKSRRPAARIWGVQPAGSNATYLSFKEGRRITIERAETIADGLTATSPGSFTFPLIQKYVDSMVTVSEGSLLAAMKQFLTEERLVVEPSGAASLAAVLEGKVPCQNTVCIISGGNVAPELMAELFSRRESERPS